MICRKWIALLNCACSNHECREINLLKWATVPVWNETNGHIFYGSACIWFGLSLSSFNCSLSVAPVGGCVPFDIRVPNIHLQCRFIELKSCFFFHWNLFGVVYVHLHSAGAVSIILQLKLNENVEPFVQEQIIERWFEQEKKIIEKFQRGCQRIIAIFIRKIERQL